MDKQIRVGKLLACILVLGFILRIWNITTNPPELFSDEITRVLSAKTILETGKDVNGHFMFYLYDKLELGTPIYGYLSAFSTYIFGNNTFAIRLPAVIAGTTSIFLIFIFCCLITKNKIVSLLGAYLATITPWMIYFSRTGWELILVIPFILTSTLLFYNAVKTGRFKFVIFSYALFAISTYASNASEVLSPLFLSVLIGLNLKAVLKNKSIHFLGLMIFTIILIPLFYVSVTNPLKHVRSIKISTFREGVNQQTLGIFVSNYFAHFTPKFLFETGDQNLRHGTGQDGVLYWSYLPFILIGIAYCLKNIKNKYNVLLLIWLLIFPLGGSLTNDGVPHATRTLIGAPVFIIFTTLGLWMVLKNKKYGVLVVVIFIVLTVLEFVVFARNYFVDYPIKSQGWWEYGQSKVFSTVKKITNGNESLCLSNIDYWHEETLTKYYLGRNNNYIITYDLNSPGCLTSQILVLKPHMAPSQKYSLIETVYSLEGNPIWNIFSLSNKK